MSKIIVSKFDKIYRPLKCLSCGAVRKVQPDFSEGGWQWHVDAAVCGSCFDSLSEQGQAIVAKNLVERGDAMRRMTEDLWQTREYEVMQCHRCGSPQGSDCKEGCPARAPDANFEIMFNAPRANWRKS